MLSMGWNLTGQAPCRRRGGVNNAQNLDVPSVMSTYAMTASNHSIWKTFQTFMDNKQRNIIVYYDFEKCFLLYFFMEINNF